MMAIMDEEQFLRLEDQNRRHVLRVDQFLHDVRIDISLGRDESTRIKQQTIRDCDEQMLGNLLLEIIDRFLLIFGQLAE